MRLVKIYIYIFLTIKISIICSRISTLFQNKYPKSETDTIVKYNFNMYTLYISVDKTERRHLTQDET